MSPSLHHCAQHFSRLEREKRERERERSSFQFPKHQERAKREGEGRPEITADPTTPTMWRRLPTHLHHHRPSLLLRPSGFAAPPPLLRRTPLVVSRYVASDAGSADSPVNKRVEELYPIATGNERRELEAELQGRNPFEMDHPSGPFGTKEAPAVVKSRYDRRIVGCPGGEDEDEHDVVWFWLEKGKPHECPVCSQYFVLEVVGPGGDPDEGHHH